jgi:hypothetical protein
MKKLILGLVFAVSLLYPGQLLPGDNFYATALAQLPSRFEVVDDDPEFTNIYGRPKIYIVRDKVLGAYYIFTVSGIYRGESASISTTMTPLIDVDGMPKIHH